MKRLRLRLPATSANLGPGFDTLAVALSLYLELEAEGASAFEIEAHGRDAAICGAAEGNLLIESYVDFFRAQGREPIALRIRMENQIPVGMGCGSSAVVRIAAAALAAHFGEFNWSRERLLNEAARLEGHPDNAAACWLGGFVASAWNGKEVQAISFSLPQDWRAVLVIPDIPLSTKTSRAVLPESYSRADVVANLQRTALLTAAIASGRADLVANGMRDWLHQPYRQQVCPLLPRLLPFSGQDGILGVALSGAGPTVILITDSERAALHACETLAREPLDLGPAEIRMVEFESDCAVHQSL